MKKFLIIMAMVLIASAVNAASVSWSGTMVSLQAPGDEKTSYTVFLVDASLFDNKADLAAEIAAGDFSSLKTAVATTHTQAQPAASSYANTHVKWASNFESDKVSESGQYYTVILNGTTADATYYMITDALNANKPYAGSTAINFGSQASNTWAPIEPVPEPTSGLLIMLGVAALALKRKKA